MIKQNVVDASAEQGKATKVAAGTYNLRNVLKRGIEESWKHSLACSY